MTAKELAQWREKMKLTRQQAAIELGMARNTYTNYENNTNPIPHYVELACWALTQPQHPRQQQRAEAAQAMADRTDKGRRTFASE